MVKREEVSTVQQKEVMCGCRQELGAMRFVSHAQLRPAPECQLACLLLTNPLLVCAGSEDTYGIVVANCVNLNLFNDGIPSDALW
jgi:hypothetical protein